LDTRVSAPAPPRASLILGVVSILLELIGAGIAAIFFHSPGGAFGGELSSLFILLFAYSGILGGGIPATIGFIFGSLAYRRDRSRFALVAIILNLIALLVSLGFLVMLLAERSTSE
jgi:hypothetical protein